MNPDPSKSDACPISHSSLSTVVFNQDYLPRHQQALNFEPVKPGNRIIVAGDQIRGRAQDGAYCGNFAATGRFAAVTDVGFWKNSDTPPGRESPRNEDGFFKLEVGDRRYVAVADGIGGEPAGDLACRTFLKHLQVRLKAGDIPRLAINRAARGLEHKHDRLGFYRKENTSSMGVCFTLAEFNDKDGSTYVSFYHAGDCRGFLLQRDSIIQTNDQTVAQLLVLKNEITANHPRYHEWNNIVVSSVSLEGGRFLKRALQLMVSQEYLLSSGDAVILGTDGLWDNIDPLSAKEIVKQSFMDADHVLSEDVPQSIVKGLYDHLGAKSRAGGPYFKKDNLGIVAVTL